MLTFMYITNDEKEALIAEKYGVQRVWVDLEVLGKEERQKGYDSVKSKHTIADVRRISKVLTKSELLVRINPWNSKSIEEIETVIEAGADLIMLPMWKSLAEVESFVSTVNRRAKTILLLETKEAADCLGQVLENGGFDEIHIGLNDLHLSYGLTFMFELLTNGKVDELCEEIKKYNIPYGFGGIARVGGGIIPAERIIKEHVRLGSTRVILSRAFSNSDDLEEVEHDFCCGIRDIRECEKEDAKLSYEELELNRSELKILVEDYLNAKK